MKDKSTMPKLITVTHTAIGVKFSPGNPSLLVMPSFNPERLSPRLAKFFAKVAKSGSGGIKVKTLSKDDRWSARFLLKIHALRDILEPKKTVASKKASAKRPARLSRPAKGAAVTPATGRL
jgi:hypothetical protein